MEKKKVLLAMSGGVDSSVAALLLQKKGYEVIGAFMKNWSDTKDPLTNQCAWRGERKHAIKIASILNIPLITLDFEKEYKKDVVEEMFKKYKKGITPNPDVDCNQKIKFPMLLREAKKRGINLIATGHYARIKKVKDKYEMLRGKDETKDQSYFLYRINQNELKHTLFPIGNYTKKEIREIAKKNKFPNYDKKGTVGICFIGKINFKEFLRKKIKPKKGKVLDPNGNKIGTHDGVFYYTIGERLGPRYGFEIKRDSMNNNENKKNMIKSSKNFDEQSKEQIGSAQREDGWENPNKPNEKFKKWYVARKDIKKNIIVAAPKDHKINFRKEIIVKNLHLISDDKEKFKKSSKKVYARIRNVGELLPSKFFYDKKTKQFKVTLNEEITGISEGQAIVLYEKDKVLGGGEIKF